MNVFLFNTRDGASLNNIIDATAHSISLFQEIEQPKNIYGIVITQTGISIAEPIAVQMYQFNDDKVLGLESILSYMNECFF